MQISTVWSMDLLIRKNFEQFDRCFSEYVKVLIIFKFEDNHLLLFWFPRVQKYLVAGILGLDDRSTRHCFV